jgi:hypothetical protein
MNQRKPLAERHPDLLRIEQLCDQDRAARSDNNLRKLANQEFMRSLSQLEHTLVGDEVGDGLDVVEAEPLPVHTSSELDDLADAVADIEAYIQGQRHSDEN